MVCYSIASDYHRIRNSGNEGIDEAVKRYPKMKGYKTIRSMYEQGLNTLQGKKQEATNIPCIDADDP